MNKIRHYTDKIYEILNQAENDGVLICTYIVGDKSIKEDLKDIGIVVCDINNDCNFDNHENLENSIFISL